MITLISIIVVIFLIWVLFVSNFDRQKRVAIAIAVIVMGGVVVWFEGYGEKPKDGVIAVSEITICGVQSHHSYRSNFNVTVCLKNNSTNASAQRITVKVLAEQCESEASCRAIEEVERDVLFELAAGAKKTLEQSLDFKDVDPALQDLRWSATVRRVQATRND